MRLLVDTHIAVWTVSEIERLPTRAIVLLNEPDAEIYVSAISVWEIAIKSALARHTGHLPMSASRAVDLFDRTGFRALPVTNSHALEVARLPQIHGDPFDRLLIAQAQVGGLALLTADARLAAYGDAVMVV